MSVAFKLPDLGENVEAGTITKILVRVGDRVAKDQPVLEIETDKAVLEVPSSVEGTVDKIVAKEGAKIKVGDTVFEVSGDGVPAKAPQREAAPEAAATAPVATSAAAAAAAAPAPEATASAPKGEAASQAAAPSPAPPVAEGEEAAQPQSAQYRGPAAAAPSVRGFAREIGIDIHEVVGTGPGGRIAIQDVKEYARRINTDVRGLGRTLAGGGGPLMQMPLPDFARFGEIERRPMTSVRRRTAENTAAAWATIPQVTQHDKVDVTELETLRKKFSKGVEAAGGKLTITAIIVKVVAAALKKFPQFNASADMANNEIIYKKFVNIGIAVDTDRGLLVPVVRDVDKKNLTEISVEISALADRARDRKTKLEEMQGGCFTISNLGGIGGTGFTPIVNAPEVAILGIARTRIEPVFVGGSFEPRHLLPLCLTYDHRVIDGADGARFMRWVVEALEQPFLLSLEG